jgi:uncharacterized protein DUF6338
MIEQKLAKHDTIPTPWDFFFRKQWMSCFVLIHFKSGGRIGGYYGVKSYASEYPEPQQIYLEALWKITAEGRFVEKVPGTLGAIIRFDECSMIELISAGGENDETRKG